MRSVHSLPVSLITCFSELVEGYQQGITPNPDILCNQKIKFDKFFGHALQHDGTSYIATGHYAGVGWSPQSNEFALTCAADTFKDQTYFIAGLPQPVLSRVCFPVGGLPKRQVKEIALKHGFEHAAKKKESMGICFIGKRKFSDFIQNYIVERPGEIVDTLNRPIGQHQGLFLFTVGQKARVSGLPERYYVVGKDTVANKVVLDRGRECSGLYSTTVFVKDVRLSSPSLLQSLQQGQTRTCRARTRHQQAPSIGTLTMQHVPSAFISSPYNRIGYVPWLPSRTELLQSLGATVPVLAFTSASPLRAVTPGQFLALYDEELRVCHGGGTIIDSV